MEGSAWFVLVAVLCFCSVLVFINLGPVMFPGLFYSTPSPGQERVAETVREQAVTLALVWGLLSLSGFAFTRLYLGRRIWTGWQFRLYAGGVMGAVCLLGAVVGLAYPVVHASRGMCIDSTYVERGFPSPWWVTWVPHYGWPGFIDVPQHSIRNWSLLLDILFWLAVGAGLVWLGVMLRLRSCTARGVTVSSRRIAIIAMSILSATLILVFLDYYDLPPFRDPRGDGLLEPEIGGHMGLEGGTERGDTWVLGPSSEAIVTLSFGPKKGVAKGVSVLLETDLTVLGAVPNWTSIREGRYQWRFTSLPGKETGRIQVKIAAFRGEDEEDEQDGYLVLYYAYTNEDPVIIANKTILFVP